jgi:ketosteroid isomerase-like protein
MTTGLPEVIAQYLRVAGGVNPADADVLVACFTEDAVVMDEGSVRRGHAAVRDWWTGPATAYQYTVDVCGTRAVGDGRYVVFTRLVGNFPGGTAELANRFVLRDGLIRELEIAPPRGEEKMDAEEPT